MANSFTVTSPFDGHKIKTLDFVSWEEVDQHLKSATALVEQRKTLSGPERAAIITKTADLVESRLDEFARAAAEEGGKPLIDSIVELKRAVQGIRETVNSMSALTGHEVPMNLNGASLNRRAFTMREPMGVVVAISAFNHPFNLIVHQVLPAIAVGAPVLVKPAATTPISCINLVNCLYEAGLPKEWCQVILCDNDVAEKMVTDSRVSFFSFIGSGKVGWYLRSKLSPGTRCALEHGGVAPVIFEESGDLESSLPLLTKGAFYHAGQVCVSVQRIFVHESRLKDMCDGMVTAAQKLKVGDPLKEDTEVGPLILAREVDRVGEWVDEAAQAGAEILCGGKKISESCYEPTVLLNPAEEAKVSQNEIFGPVVNIYSYSDRLDAIKKANNLPFSFQASVFTKNIDVAWDTVQRLNAAAVMVNDHTAFRVDWMPFAGHKSSGLGVGGILPTMLEMTEEKLVVFKSSVL